MGGRRTSLGDMSAFEKGSQLMSWSITDRSAGKFILGGLFRYEAAVETVDDLCVDLYFVAELGNCKRWFTRLG